MDTGCAHVLFVDSHLIILCLLLVVFVEMVRCVMMMIIKQAADERNVRMAADALRALMSPQLNAAAAVDGSTIEMTEVRHPQPIFPSATLPWEHITNSVDARS
jgi:hypothetical protein